MKILIRGGGFENKGAEAMLLSCRQALGSTWPEAKFYMTSTSGKLTHAASCGIEALVPEYKLGEYLKMLVGRVPVGELSSRERTRQAVRTQAEIRATPVPDIVLDLSGFAYGDAWRSRYVEQTLRWMNAFPSSKFYFLPQAWGPFEDRASAELVRKMLERSSGFWARDEISRNHLSDLLNIPLAEVAWSPDIALSFEEGDRVTGETLIKCDYGFTEFTQPKVIIVPNRHVYHRMTGTKENSTYILLLELIVQRFLEQGVSIILVATEMNMGGREPRDDRSLCRFLAEKFNPDEKVYTSDKWYTAAQVQSILMCADFIVTSRFHGAVLALAKGVPVSTLGWSHKYRELMRFYDQEEYALEPLHQDVSEVAESVVHAYASRIEAGENLSNHEVVSLNKKLWSVIENKEKLGAI